MARSNLLDIGAISSILIYLAKGRDGGYASPSRYEVVITQPPKLPGNTDVLREINMETTQVSFPGMALEVQEDVNIYGPVRKIVTGQTFSEISTPTISLSGKLSSNASRRTPPPGPTSRTRLPVTYSNIFNLSSPEAFIVSR